MEETQTAQNPYPTSESVGFPPQAQPKRKSGALKWIALIIVGILLIGGAAFFVLQGSETGEPEETPSVQGINFVETPQPEATTNPTPTAAPINREEISIEVLNGTGITGEAGYLETQLKGIGYTSLKTGNASGGTVSTTTVTFNTSVSKTISDEITAKLEGIYQKVESKTSSNTGSYDVKIVVGLRKGATPKPASTTKPISASGTPAASGTATPKASATPSN